MGVLEIMVLEWGSMLLGEVLGGKWWVVILGKIWCCGVVAMW
jgi:hypothetical protein